MRKIITITDPRQAKVGDKAYFKDCDFGFTVSGVDADDEYNPIAVYNPLSGSKYWTSLSQFDHATREAEEPEWPDPHDAKLHINLGADGVQYYRVYGIVNGVEGYYACDENGTLLEPYQPWFMGAAAIALASSISPA